MARNQEARMPIGNIYPGCINGVLCNNGRPARPIHTAGYCWPCWASMTSAQRDLEIWEQQNTQATEELDTDELLHMLATMATFDDGQHFKDAA